jgi:hypothetical protein
MHRQTASRYILDLRSNDKAEKCFYLQLLLAICSRGESESLQQRTENDLDLEESERLADATPRSR